MENREERIERILKQIDPSFRLTKLEQQLNNLQDRFMDVMADVNGQRTLVDKHQERANAIPKDDKAARAIAQSNVERAKEALESIDVLVELIVLQIEETLEKIDEIKSAGTKEKKKEEK